ncbi:hypothetical protein DENIS_3326 [Desulfonema ishimotonii]|uniref:histidine kinase n=1 Tax=Desulfonema ishimotonii TaxID=45657 RepID=A0A401FZF7_9BACT|nr:response regulator [Desulfonema ishimotonii]GBC62354.1 hypothetical protein DENIS_3326 [Desulfonema ishimotonii]
MIKFKDKSIKYKLTAIITMTSTIALLFASSAFLIAEFALSRRSMEKELSILAEVIGTNCSAALLFDDRDSAVETLSAVKAVPHIISATVYKKDGRPFAGYNAVRTGHTIARVDLRSVEPGYRGPENGYRFYNGYLDVCREIVLDSEIIGVVHLKSGLKELYARLMWHGIFCGIITSVSLILAYFISSRLQGMFSKPILHLARTMGEVSAVRDYTLRANKFCDDELGDLIDGFNDMLEQIRQRDEKLKLTQFSIEHSGDAAFWISRGGRFFYVNNEACSYLGYSCEELLAMRMADIDPEITEKNWPVFWETSKQRKSHTAEARHRRKDNSLVPVEIANNFLEFQGNEYVCVFARNIEDRKRMEAQLQKAEKMEAIGTLAAGVAHDLNNILSGVVSYPELLLMDMPEDSIFKEPILKIQKSGQKAAAIVQDMLTLARRGVAIADIVNLNDMVSDYFRSTEYEKLKSFHPKVRFKTDLAEDLLNISGSPVHLSKTVMNLISNAAEAMPAGGEVSIRTANRYVDHPISGYDTVSEGEYAVLNVADTGIGISVDDLEKIFEPFYTKKVMGRSGTGLGMSVVWATLKDHRGYIDIHTAEGAGTQFALYFPVTRQALEKREARFVLERFTGCEKILVVDDVRVQREIASRMLIKMGYDVRSVPSGEMAIEYVKEAPVDLLVLDMIMEPGIDGLATYRRILDIWPRQKAIIASGFSETDRVREALRLGAGAYVKKPYTLENIVKAVRYELDRQA